MYKKSRKAEKSAISIPNQDVQCLYEERQPRPPKRKRGQRSKKFYMTMHDFVTDSAWLSAARFSISSKHNSNTLPEWVHQPKFRSKNESHKPTLMFSFALVSTKAALFSFASLSPLAASTWRLYIDQYHVRKKSNSREIFKFVHQFWWRNWIWKERKGTTHPEGARSHFDPTMTHGMSPTPQKSTILSYTICIISKELRDVIEYTRT